MERTQQLIIDPDLEPEDEDEGCLCAAYEPTEDDDRFCACGHPNDLHSGSGECQAGYNLGER